jgi:aspartate/methionine/tyrosine aminotransferase
MEILRCKFSKDQTGLFMWGRIPDETVNCEEFVEEILNKAHVFLTPGFIFGTMGERYIRISLCADNERMKQALDRIANQSQITNHKTPK